MRAISRKCQPLLLYPLQLGYQELQSEVQLPFLLLLNDLLRLLDDIELSRCPDFVA